MAQPLTIRAIGGMFGFSLPSSPGKGKCPLRQHVRQDNTFRVYPSSSSSDELCRCWSCDPPDNMGDAIWLYSKLANVDRKEAWKALGAQGYDVPGWEDRGGSRPDEHPTPRQPRGPHTPEIPPLRGSKLGTVLPLDPLLLEGWTQIDTGVLAKFAEARQIGEAVLRAHGVIEMPSRNLGFVYHDPDGKPCRVKIRNMKDVGPRFWMEPKGEGKAKALAPLYLGHLLAEREVGPIQPAIIVEGETDALSLVAMGIANVVSLPDGAESAKTVNLAPIFQRFNAWLVATDDDAAGDVSYQLIRERGRSYGGTDVIRVHWKRMVGEELVSYKDANEALQRGSTREDFARCLDVAMETRFGSTVTW